jgi:D-alanyl-D-alanine carboxypeptidase-like protein
MKTTLLIVLVVIAVLTAPAGWYLARQGLVPKPEDTVDPRLAEIAELQQKTKNLTIDLNVLTKRIIALEERGAGAEERVISSGEDTPPADALADSFAQVVLIANRREVNLGLTNSGSEFLMKLFGPPRDVLTDQCEEMTNPLLRDMIKLEDVGPVRVQMLAPAILSLRQVFKNVQIFEPELYARLSTAGSLCVRYVRGIPGAASTHAYGLSVDLNVDGMLDSLGDGRTQLGLILLADFFNKEGWYWGAGFSREDSMHFQVSKEKILQWKRQGLITTLQ